MRLIRCCSLPCSSVSRYRPFPFVGSSIVDFRFVKFRATHLHHEVPVQRRQRFREKEDWGRENQEEVSRQSPGETEFRWRWRLFGIHDTSQTFFPFRFPTFPIVTLAIVHDVTRLFLSRQRSMSGFSDLIFTPPPPPPSSLLLLFLFVVDHCRLICNYVLI